MITKPRPGHDRHPQRRYGPPPERHDLHGGCAAEAVVTFVLVLVVVAVATDTRVPRGIAAMAIGAALAVTIVIAGPVSGADVNPARAIGPMILAGQFSDWWAYLTAPLAGGVAAVALYDRFLRAGAHLPSDDARR